MPKQRNSGIQFMKCFHLNSICLVDIKLLYQVLKKASKTFFFFFLKINSAMTGFCDDVITTMLLRACRLPIYYLKSFHIPYIFFSWLFTLMLLAVVQLSRFILYAYLIPVQYIVESYILIYSIIIYFIQLHQLYQLITVR